MKVSILIPTKNEPLINELIEKIHQILNGFEHEIIIIDKSDLAPDIRNAKLVFQQSNGLGRAVLEGLHHATGNIIVTMDGDFSHDPNDLLKLIEKTDCYDIVIGSRFVTGGVDEDETYRKLVRFIFRKLTSLILDLDVEDNMSGFIAVKRHIYDNLKINPVGFKINMEIMFKAKKKNYKICEVPITFHKRVAGETKAGISFSGLKEAIQILRYLIELRFNLR